MTPRDKQPPQQATRPHRKDHAAEVANTFEWLITAFILAFLFRAFVMEAFRIPTGSMADTLMGAHFRLGCPACGYGYAHGFVPGQYGLPEDTVPPGGVLLPPVRCPSCGYIQQSRPGETVQSPVFNGDRILVLKCLYQFSPPKRWDVVVFKNPTNPTQNYIKRLIGLPNETIEIVDGDIYVDGQIARKPPRVQDELWMPIYDNDFQPVDPRQPLFNLRPWQMPLDRTGSAWTTDSDKDPTRLHLDDATGQNHVLSYRSPSANLFHAVYAYNGLSARAYASAPACSDLMVRTVVDFNDPASRVGVSLTRYGTVYEGSLDAQGRMEIAQVTDGQRSVLAGDRLTADPVGTPLLLRFAHVDRRLVLHVGRRTLTYDFDGSRPSADTRRGNGPQVQVFGSGRMTLSHVAIFRDIYYTSDPPRRDIPPHAIEGHPFRLESDEFFVCGDNSPNSEDARWWPAPTTASRGQEPPRAGVVPRDYMMGKALFVYWPGGFEFPWPRTVRSFAEATGRPGPLRVLQALIRLRWIPNVGKMRFIYGGSGRSANPVDPATGQDPSLHPS
ncbi:MAG: signal peptidase I [Phycisphaerae bacterium]|nr:signal peptidase I [Phycisphaerae bacterium]